MTSFYKPTRIAERAIIATDGPSGTPYQLLAGVVNLFDLGSGSISAQFPANPEANDSVIIKNTRGQYLGAASENVLTLHANGHEVEVPGLHDTAVIVGTGGSFAVAQPRLAVRWVFLPGDPNGTWLIDNDYDAGSTITHVSDNYTIHPSEMVFADSSAGPITLTIPEGLPDDTYFFASKKSNDQNVVTVQASGAEQIVAPQAWLREPLVSYAIIDRSETVTWVKNGSLWQPVNAIYDPYFELFYLPAIPIDITPGASLLPIALHPEWQQSLLFESNVGGLLTVSSDIEGTVMVTVQIQVILEHILTSNNADVDVEIVAQSPTAGANSIIVPVRSSFAHSRSGTFGDTRSSSSLLLLSAGDTLGFYAEELDSASGSTDITGLIISMEA